MNDLKQRLSSVRYKLATLTSTIYEMCGKKLRNVMPSLESAKQELVLALYFPMTSWKRLKLLKKRMLVLLIFWGLMLLLAALPLSLPVHPVVYLVLLAAYMLGTMIIIFVGRD